MDTRYISIVAALMITAASAANSATIEINVNGLVCGFCAQGIEKTLRKNAATQDVIVSLEHRLVVISTKPGADIADETLRKALQDAGYDVKTISRTERTMDTIRSQLKGRQ